jgi:hypothetical protein
VPLIKKSAFTGKLYFSDTACLPPLRTPQNCRKNAGPQGKTYILQENTTLAVLSNVKQSVNPSIPRLNVSF